MGEEGGLSLELRDVVGVFEFDFAANLLRFLDFVKQAAHVYRLAFLLLAEGRRVLRLRLLQWRYWWRWLELR